MKNPRTKTYESPLAHLPISKEIRRGDQPDPIVIGIMRSLLHSEGRVFESDGMTGMAARYFLTHKIVIRRDDDRAGWWYELLPLTPKETEKTP